MRRALLIVLVILWCLNGALLAWVKTSAPPAPVMMVRMAITVDKADKAKAVEKALAKYNAVPKRNYPWTHTVIEGFRCIQKQDNESLAPALAQAMSNAKLQVKVVKEGVQLGGVYKTRADAIKAQKSAQAKGFAFEIVENEVERTTKATRFVVGPLTGEEKQQVDDALAPFKLKEEQIEVDNVEAKTPSPK